MPVTLMATTPISVEDRENHRTAVEADSQHQARHSDDDMHREEREDVERPAGSAPAEDRLVGRRDHYLHHHSGDHMLPSKRRRAGPFENPEFS